MDRAALVADIDARLAQATRALDQVGVFACLVQRLHTGEGDRELVTAIDGRFRRLVRDEDHLAWLDDRHVVVVTSSVATDRDLRAVATRLLDAVAQPLRFRDGSTGLLGLSIGVASTVLEPGASGDELLAGAEAAMARAHRDGADRYVLLEPALRRELEARAELAAELRAGLDEELEVHYQPVVDLATGAVDNLEALARWRHPVRGLVHPASFLPLAAEAGLSGRIGELVFAHACRQAVVWSEARGRPAQVSVNAGLDEVLGTDLVATIERCLAASGLPAGQLLVEISEEMLVEHPGPISLVLGRVALTGVGVVADRASGSPASFRLLGSLPALAAVKLDPALVAGLDDGTTEPAALASVVRRAGALGVAVVATGVERPEQVPALRQAGITTGQGFALGRPAQVVGAELASCERWT